MGRVVSFYYGFQPDFSPLSMPHRIMGETFDYVQIATSHLTQALENFAQALIPTSRTRGTLTDFFLK